jgi:2-phosphosulfolactate phosphatase
MEVRIESLLEGASRATGAVAIIDVFRAFTTAAVALANGATEITMVGSVEEALSLREQGIGQLCIGEVKGIAPPGFDFGNSPFELSKANLKGKSIIQRTSAGTNGIVTATRATCLYAASLVTARATARALRATFSDRITLVAMGEEGIERSSEDEICALHLSNLLENRPGDADATRQMILAGKEAMRFNDPGRPQFLPGDLAIALDIDRYDFAIRVDVQDNRPVARIDRAVDTSPVQPLRK